MGKNRVWNDLDDDPEMQAALRTLGLRVRELRLKAGMSQGELGQRIRAPQTYIALIELGSARPTLTAIWLIARALDVAPDQLLPVSGAPQLALELGPLTRSVEALDAIEAKLDELRQLQHDTAEARRELQWLLRRSLVPSGEQKGES